MTEPTGIVRLTPLGDDLYETHLLSEKEASEYREQVASDAEFVRLHGTDPEHLRRSLASNHGRCPACNEFVSAADAYYLPFGPSGEGVYDACTLPLETLRKQGV